MHQIINERQILERAFHDLCDGKMECATILIYIKANYVRWQAILIWLKKNDLRGQKMIDFFANESPDGGGYMMGVQFLLSRLDGEKNSIKTLKVDQLK